MACRFCSFLLLLLFSFLNQPASAQQTGIRVEQRIDETTPITDKSTGKRISFSEYQDAIKADPQAYRLEPVFDEYGKAASYMMRPAMGDELRT